MVKDCEKQRQASPASSDTLYACNKYMFENGLASDFKFICLTPEGSQEVVHAHKYVLISRSPVFRAMLTGGFPINDDTITITDITATSFKEILRYLYYEQAEIDADNILEILYGAKKYLLDVLVKRCLAFLQGHLDEENVCHVLQLALFYEEPDLRDVCLDVIQRKARVVLKSQAFLDLPHEVALLILKMDILNAPESDVLEACLKWAEQECQRQALPVTKANQRYVLQSILYQIRMTKLPQEVLHKQALETDLLSKEEKMSLSNLLNDTQNEAAEPKTNLCVPFVLTSRRRSKADYSVCNIVQKRYESTTIGGRWINLPIESSHDIELLGLDLLDKTKGSYTVKVDVVIMQDDEVLGMSQASLSSPRKKTENGSLMIVPFKPPIIVKKGKFIIRVCYKFAFGMYGVVPSGQPAYDAIECDDVTFKFDKHDCSRIYSFNFREIFQS